MVCNYCSTVGVSPPMNVQASQASPSDPVEVSWRPPSDGATTITGYRIFYSSGMNILVPPDIISIHFTTDASYVGQRVTVCTEAEQLTSQCTSAAVITGEKRHFTDDFIYMMDFVFFVSDPTASTSAKCTCSNETGIAVGVTVVLLLLVEVVIVFAVVLCGWKRYNRIIVAKLWAEMHIPSITITIIYIQMQEVTEQK